MNFSIIGCGPGNLIFLTFKSIKLIFYYKIIFYESLINLNFLNYSISKNHKYLIGKRFNQKSILKKTIYIVFLIYFIKYKFILNLKSGDINVFSRINNEIKYLNFNKINFNLISGITSINLVLSRLSYILTFRFNLSSILFITYLNSNLNIKYNKNFVNKTIIYYMINNNFNYILEEIINFNYFNYLLLIESSSYFIEHIFVFNINDLIFNFFDNFLFFFYPKIILINYFLIFLNLKNFFIKFF